MLVMAVERRDSSRGGFVTLLLGNSRGRLPTSPFWPEDQPRSLASSQAWWRWWRARWESSTGGASSRSHRSSRCRAARSIGAASCRRSRRSHPTGGRWIGGAGRSRDRGFGSRSICSMGRGLPRTLRVVSRQHRRTHADLGGLSVTRARSRPSGVPSPPRAGPIASRARGRVASRHRRTRGVSLGGRVRDHRLRRPAGSRHAGHAHARGAPPRRAAAHLHGRQATFLQHLIASHHGRQEFGAAVPPMTLEAEILHFADNAAPRPPAWPTHSRI